MRSPRLLALALALALAVLFNPFVKRAAAAPIAPAQLAQDAAALSPKQDVRLYCYNRYSGQFLHWGSCGGYRRHYVYRPHYYYRPRYYRPRYVYHRPRYHRHYYYRYY